MSAEDTAAVSGSPRSQDTPRRLFLAVAERRERQLFKIVDWTCYGPDSIEPPGSTRFLFLPAPTTGGRLLVAAAVTVLAPATSLTAVGAWNPGGLSALRSETPRGYETRATRSGYSARIAAGRPGPVVAWPTMPTRVESVAAPTPSPEPATLRNLRGRRWTSAPAAVVQQSVRTIEIEQAPAIEQVPATEQTPAEEPTTTTVAAPVAAVAQPASPVSTPATPPAAAPDPEPDPVADLAPSLAPQGPPVTSEPAASPVLPELVEPRLARRLPVVPPTAAPGLPSTPAPTPGPSTPTPAAPGTPIATPSIPAPPPAAAATGFVFGLVAQRDGNDMQIASSIGAKVVRAEFDVSAPASSLDHLVNGYGANGVLVQPLAGFESVPSAADAANMREWALRHGPQGTGHIRNIEWGNENSFGYKAQANGYAGTSAYLAWAGNYARSAVAAANALQGTGVGLLIQLDDADGWPWVEGMKAAVPDLDRYAAGWTIHPYGPGGRDKLAKMIQQARDAGWSDSIRFYATEWGIATDNGRSLSDNYGFPTDVSYAEAAALLRNEVDFYRSQGRVAQLLYYMSTDGAGNGSSSDREDYFGLYAQNGNDKGMFTAEARAQAAS